MRREHAATGVEYAVLLGMIAAVIFLAVSFLGTSASKTFECAGSAMGGDTCVQGVQITVPEVTPSPSRTCTSQNGEHGNGCFDK